VEPLLEIGVFLKTGRRILFGLRRRCGFAGMSLRLPCRYLRNFVGTMGSETSLNKVENFELLDGLV
jgi:hypothetical protein